MTVRAALYLRVSLDITGEYLAVDRQRADCTTIAEQRGWTIVGEYVDNSISASDARKQRPGYDELASAYARGDIDAIICWDLDRLTRQPRQMEDWIEAADTRGLAIVTANGEADLSTDGGRMYARIKLAVARQEIERKSARQRAAGRQRAASGLPRRGGVRALGYTSDGDELVPHEADTIRQLFARAMAGESIYSLTAWLNTGVLETRYGRPWSEASVRTILTNPRYAGRVKYQGVIQEGVVGQWPTIVDAATFDLMQATLSNPSRRTATHTHRTRLGSGLYRCGECGSTVRGFSAKSYRCRNGCLTRTGADIDEYVTEAVAARLARPDLVEVLAGVDEDAAKCQEEMKRLRARLDTIGADYDAGVIDGARYASATERVQRELASAEARFSATALGGLRSVLSADDPAAAFRAESVGVRQSVIDALVVVLLHRGVRGVHGFRTDSVTMDWRTRGGFTA